MEITFKEINKYLTEEVFDECWHDCCMSTNCRICGKTDDPRYSPIIDQRKDFFTTYDCMVLWLKIQEMDWFDAFIDHHSESEIEFIHGRMSIYQNWWIELIHPDRLAPAVCQFLKNR